MGRSCSSEQEELLAYYGTERLTLLLDGDPPGREAQAKLLVSLAHRFYVRSLWLPDGAEPDTVDEHLLVQLLERGQL